MHGGWPCAHHKDDLERIKLPLPAIATQQAIVADDRSRAALVNGNRELIARFERKIAAMLARIWGDDDAVSPAGQSADPLSALTRDALRDVTRSIAHSGLLHELFHGAQKLHRWQDPPDLEPSETIREWPWIIPY